MDVREHNRRAWNEQVRKGNPWTMPVTPEEVAAARRGEWVIVLTPRRPVPRDWFPDLADAHVLCLASGGGQQGPILAAAGARVVVFDNSPAQLGQDRMVADREGLALDTVEGDMADLGVFPDAAFALIVHPVSNVFVPSVLPVWAEAFRVLRPGGALLAGVVNPVEYLFDAEQLEQGGPLTVRHDIPYSDLDQFTEEQKARHVAEGLPFEYGHTLEDLIGGQLRAGFLLAGFYEDSQPPEHDALSAHLSPFLATRAVKPHPPAEDVFP